MSALLSLYCTGLRDVGTHIVRLPEVHHNFFPASSRTSCGTCYLASESTENRSPSTATGSGSGQLSPSDRVQVLVTSDLSGLKAALTVASRTCRSTFIWAASRQRTPTHGQLLRPGRDLASLRLLGRLKRLRWLGKGSLKQRDVAFQPRPVSKSTQSWPKGGTRGLGASGS